MATQEKLLKSLEILKNLSAPNQTFDPSKKKEKIQHCHVVTEAISNSTIKIAPNFQTYLSITVEVLLQLCDDPESDVRMTAGDCLNRIIRALIDGNIGKVQIELHKGIKRNGAARSLRVALKCFAQLAHFIRPHKGKPYVVNLFPTLIKVSERSEEQIHETLANSVLPIMKVLGSFASDVEIKALLKGFLKNVTNSSPAIRRSATSSLLHVCLNCRKPYIFITYVTNYLLDILIPVSDNQGSHLILGVLTSLKNVIPYLNLDQSEKNTRKVHNATEVTSISVDRLLQIYELCVYYLSSKDHNVVNAALEALNSLFQNCPHELKQILLCERGIDKSRISLSTSLSLATLRSPSQLSVATTAPTEDLFIESELTDTLRSDIEKWIDQSKLSVMNVTCAKSNELEKSISFDSKSSSIDATLSHIDSFEYKVPEFTSKTHSIGDNLERLTVSDNSSDKSFSYAEDDRLPDVTIGSFLDNDIPLIYCARLIVKSFLLSGHVGVCISDKSVRVSVKSLALTCLSSITQMYPQILTLQLDKNKTKSKKTCQQISDVILFENHSDPQLRGYLRILLANFISAVLDQMCYSHWIQKYFQDDANKFSLGSLIDIILKGLNDESWSCTRQTILGLKICTEKIIESSSNEFILPVLQRLPVVASNPYWLVKVTLCEFIATLPFVTIYYVTGSNQFQSRILDDVLFPLLKNEDSRVRNGAATAIVRIIPQLYYYEIDQNTITTKAILYKNQYLSNLCDSDETNDLMQKHLVENTPFPFSEILKTSCDRTEFALSKVVTKLFTCVLTATSNHFIFGCIETLSLLSDRYPTTLYTNAWNCRKVSPENTRVVALDFFNICVYLLSHSVINYDLSCHLNLLRLSSNLYAGFSLCFLRPVSEVELTNQAWDMFANPKFSKLAEHYLHHLVKLLNIFHYVLDDVFPTQPQSKAVLANLSASSPIKRRKSDLDKKLLSPNRTPEKEDKEKKDSAKLNTIGGFAHLPYYMKIYEYLRQSYSNYKVTLESEASEKFLGLLKQTLQSFSVMMEVATLVEFQGIAEEILSYFRLTFVLEASGTVECVQQLLKCLFGNNLATNELEISKKDRQFDDSSGFYHNLIQKPYADISTCFSAFKNVQRVECDGDNTLMGYLHRKESIPALPTHSSDKILANYIRIFEPMVIKSLKHYTITSDVKLQCKVLQLLNQLIQLRVNYCLLDSEQIFIGFVLKQFEYIEEGQVTFANELIKKIFQFLVQLSHSKQHSKSIITIPKIIQLCDGLTASGQFPLTHCIPALEPIVENIFLTRNKLSTVDAKDLETTRDVVLSMLLRLCEYHEVIDLIVLILDDSKYCSNDPEKWSRWSSQVINAVLPMLRLNKIRLDRAEAFVSLRKLVFVLEPSVFKPVDGVLLLLFQEELNYENWQSKHTRRLAKILTILLLLSPLKEEVLINKINELKAEFAPCSIFDNCTRTVDPLNVLNSVDIFNGVVPEMIFVRFLFKTVLLASSFCNENDFLVEEVAILLMYCIHILQTGSHCKIAVYAISNTNIIQLDEISRNLCKLTHRPVLTILWCYVLTLLNYNDKDFWLKMIQMNPNSVDEKIVATGGVILFCDYMNQDTVTDQAAWFLDHYIIRIIELCDEDPVFEFICSVHRNKSTSKIFVNSLINVGSTSMNPVFVLKILKSVENTHPDHTGTLLKLLVPQLLLSKELSISRQVANLASRKIELLLTMNLSEVNDQLSKNDLLDIIRKMINFNLVRSHEALASLLNKLCTQYYDVSPLEFDQKRTIKPDQIKQLKIDKNWYLAQLKTKCNSKETAKLLCQLEFDELCNLMDNEFPKIILNECLRLGLNDTNKEKSALFRASVQYLLQEVKKITSQTPKFDDEIFFNSLYQTIPAVSGYVEALCHVSHDPKQNDNLVKFGVLCLESVAHLISNKNNFNVNYITLAVRCTELIVAEKDLCVVFEDKSHISHLCSAINSLYKLVTFLCKNPLPICEKYGLEAALHNNLDIGEACYQLYTLVTWLYNVDSRSVVPTFLFKPIKNIIVSMARLSVVNSYMLIPVQVWKSGWVPELLGDYHIQVPPLPVDFLQEIDILEEFIFRITLLGWTSRQQFEETWMCMLSVLCSNSEFKDSDIVHASSLAVKAITALLVQTLYFPEPGHPNVSELIHVSRYTPISEKNGSVKKLRAIQDALEKKYVNAVCLPVMVNIFKHPNFEKRGKQYSYGQMSVKYLLVATKTVDVEDDCPAWKIWQRRQNLLESSGLDVNSCLQFLLDYYTQHLKNQTSTPLRFLHEIVRSTVIISDLFTDKSQFSWMLEIFLELSKTHTVDDELLHQYLIVGIAKATAVLTPDLETYETMKKLLVQYLKSSFLPSRMSCLYGLLYILEGCKLSNISIGGISDEMQLILPCAVEYVQCNLNSNNTILKQSPEHTILVWTLAFFLIESVDEIHLEPNFVTNTLHAAFTVLLQQKPSNSLQVVLLKAIERLVVTRKNLTKNIGKQVLSLALDRIKSDNPHVSLMGTQLLLTYMYTDSSDQLEADISDTNPDHLVQTVEKISAIFEHIKRGHVFEVDILCHVLPEILNDFFSPADILTKVIGEFLSPQQPHPKFLSGVVFQVFKRAIEEKQLLLLQDWVVFSLSNFTQSLSVGMATWCLNCFFISASSNKWLRLFFPYVQTRVGRYEYEDRKMLCIAGSDFYKNLTNKKQKETFIENFNKIKDQLDTLFIDLLSSL